MNPNPHLRRAAVAAAALLALHGAHAFSLSSLFGGTKTGDEASATEVIASARALAERQEAWLQPFVAATYRDGEWGAVLNLQRLGLAAIEKKRLDIARRAFDEAIARVEAIYADDANAAQARSVFNAEKVKDFKGEPYERAMLYYYRGLLYAAEGDYQNARASFLAADRHDTLSSAEDAAFTGNFGLMKYLAGWASQCDGDEVRARQLTAEARAADGKIAALPEPPAAALLLVETGAAPEKWADGPHREILKFRGSSAIEPQARTADGSALHLAGDVVFQATTRGGREIDGIMAGKARFKEGAGLVGDVAMQTGMQVAMLSSSMGDQSGVNAGLAGMLIGLVAKGVEKATTPAADLRAWDTLPAKVWLASASTAPALPHVLIDGSPRGPLVTASHRGCALALVRSGSALARDAGGSAAFGDDKPMEGNRGDRNKQFRVMLADELLASK